MNKTVPASQTEISFSTSFVTCLGIPYFCLSTSYLISYISDLKPKIAFFRCPVSLGIYKSQIVSRYDEFLRHHTQCFNVTLVFCTLDKFTIIKQFVQYILHFMLVRSIFANFSKTTSILFGVFHNKIPILRLFY